MPKTPLAKIKGAMAREMNPLRALPPADDPGMDDPAGDVAPIDAMAPRAPVPQRPSVKASKGSATKRKASALTQPRLPTKAARDYLT